MAKKTLHLLSHDEIIAHWEKSHKTKKHRSRLSDYETIIREKIVSGYTQQSIAELLSRLGCMTTHQSISHYLKSHPEEKFSNKTDTIIHKKDKPAQKEIFEPIGAMYIHDMTLSADKKGETGVSKLMQEIDEYIKI